MKENFIKNEKIIVGVVFVLFAIFYSINGNYWISFFTLILLLALLKIEHLTKIVFDKGKAIMHFNANKEKREKLKDEIRSNNEIPTPEKLINFQNIENKIIAKVHNQIGGELKQQIHYAYKGQSGKFDFVFTPDATIKINNDLIFIEVKHIINPIYANKIIKEGLDYLEDILTKFKPFSKNANLQAKLIIASDKDLHIDYKDVPKNINIEFVNYATE